MLIFFFFVFGLFLYIFGFHLFKTCGYSDLSLCVYVDEAAAAAAAIDGICVCGHVHILNHGFSKDQLEFSFRQQFNEIVRILCVRHCGAIVIALVDSVFLVWAKDYRIIYSLNVNDCLMFYTFFILFSMCACHFCLGILSFPQKKIHIQFHLECVCFWCFFFVFSSCFSIFFHFVSFSRYRFENARSYCRL